MMEQRDAKETVLLCRSWSRHRKTKQEWKSWDDIEGEMDK